MSILAAVADAAMVCIRSNRVLLVSLVPESRGGPFVFWDDLPAACRQAKQLGFDAVEHPAASLDAVAISSMRQLFSMIMDWPWPQWALAQAGSSTA